MKRPVTLILAVLLVGSLLFGVWQSAENQRLQRENADLKQQLDTTAQKLRQAQDEKRNLQTQLNETQQKVAELQVQVNQLEQEVKNQTAEIERLREQLKIKNYVTVGLSFMWNPIITYLPNLDEDVDYMNDYYWDKFQVLFSSIMRNHNRSYQ